MKEIFQSTDEKKTYISLEIFRKCNSGLVNLLGTLQLIGKPVNSNSEI